MATTEDAINAILSGSNVAVLGGGGRGKSTLINTLSDFFSGCMLKVGPTGTSAIQMNGQTAHRTFGLAMEPFVEGVTLKKNLKKERAAILRSPEIQMLIIDEIGALRSDKLQEIDYVCRKYRDRDKPFGGLQVCVFGDYLQLSPVVTQDDQKVLMNHYPSPFAFDCDAYKQADFQTIMLTQNFRQNDTTQQKILDNLRFGENKKEVIEYLNDVCYNDKHLPNSIILAGTNKTVDEHNQFHLQNLSGNARIFKAVVKGEFKEEPSPKILELKVGAKVLTTQNDDDGKYCNGSGGIVTRIYRNEVEVELNNGNNVVLNPKTSYNYELYIKADGTIGEKVIGSYTQIPLRLGAAITIHRSQGMTLDQVDLVLPQYSLFGDNMLYVAVSRCRDLSNLKLNRKLNINDIKTNQYVVNYMKSLM